MSRMHRVEIGAYDDPPVVQEIRNGVGLVVGFDEVLEDDVLKPLLEDETSDDLTNANMENYRPTILIFIYSFFFLNFHLSKFLMTD